MHQMSLKLVGIVLDMNNHMLISSWRASSPLRTINAKQKDMTVHISHINKVLNISNMGTANKDHKYICTIDNLCRVSVNINPVSLHQPLILTGHNTRPHLTKNATNQLMAAQKSALTIAKNQGTTQTIIGYVLHPSRQPNYLKEGINLVTLCQRKVVIRKE